MNKTQIAMTNEQWQTVIDAVNDKYPDSDCMDILINSVPYFPTFLNNEHYNNHPDKYKSFSHILSY